MISEVLAQYIGIPQSDIKNLLSLSLEDLYDSPAYNKLVQQLDFDLLHETLPDARKVYESVVPTVIDSISSEFKYTGRGMTAFTLGNWLVGFLARPDQLFKLADIHSHIPVPAIEAGLPLILAGLSDMDSGGKQWSKAMAVLSLPFFVRH